MTDKTVFLTFDDGPHPVITPWVLSELKKYGAKATFFCIGKNVVQHEAVYRQILTDGHAVGNHTFSHVNGWHTPATIYLQDAAKAAAVIQSSLFRPPYGRITRHQAKKLPTALQQEGIKIIMWDVLSADFDRSVTPERCSEIVLKRVEPGSIVVFHDSEKAYQNLRKALPAVLRELKKEGYLFRKIEEGL